MVKPLQNATARLSARPAPPTGQPVTGLQRLNLEDKRDGLVYVPPAYRADRPTPLVLILHGAGGNAAGGLELLHGLAEDFGLLLLAVDSRSATWDVIMKGYGRDVQFIDHSLTQVFNTYAIDTSHLAIAGFSDGASYALSLGLTNGDLFTHVIAFSPGFMAPTGQTGEPRIFMAHGTDDQVLPIERCSRRLAPQLREADYDLHYEEFVGPHIVSPGIAHRALEWFTAPVAI